MLFAKLIFVLEIVLCIVAITRRRKLSQLSHQSKTVSSGSNKMSQKSCGRFHFGPIHEVGGLLTPDAIRCAWCGFIMDDQAVVRYQKVKSQVVEIETTALTVALAMKKPKA